MKIKDEEIKEYLTHRQMICEVGGWYKRQNDGIIIKFDPISFDCLLTDDILIERILYSVKEYLSYKYFNKGKEINSIIIVSENNIKINEDFGIDYIKFKDNNNGE